MVDAYYMTNEADYHDILKRGSIIPTNGWYGKRLFPEDFLAGDHQYVFLSVSERHVIYDEDGEEINFGVILDAEALTTEHNVLVGPDLLNEYRILLNQCATEVVQQNSALKNAPLIVRGVLGRTFKEPGVTETALLFRTRVSELQDTYRCRGEAALSRIQEASEPLELLIKVASLSTAS